MPITLEYNSIQEMMSDIMNGWNLSPSESVKSSDDQPLTKMPHLTIRDFHHFEQTQYALADDKELVYMDMNKATGEEIKQRNYTKYYYSDIFENLIDYDLKRLGYMVNLINNFFHK